MREMFHYDQGHDAHSCLGHHCYTLITGRGSEEKNKNNLHWQTYSLEMGWETKDRWISSISNLQSALSNLK